VRAVENVVNLETSLATRGAIPIDIGDPASTRQIGYFGPYRRGLVKVEGGACLCAALNGHWHRATLELYWRWLSRKHVRVARNPEPRTAGANLRMVAEDRTSAAPQNSSASNFRRTVLRRMRKAPRNPAKGPYRR
jgi:hypothetical protein